MSCVKLQPKKKVARVFYFSFFTFEDERILEEPRCVRGNTFVRDRCLVVFFLFFQATRKKHDRFLRVAVSFCTYAHTELHVVVDRNCSITFFIFIFIFVNLRFDFVDIVDYCVCVPYVRHMQYMVIEVATLFSIAHENRRIERIGHTRHRCRRFILFRVSAKYRYNDSFIQNEPRHHPRDKRNKKTKKENQSPR